MYLILEKNLYFFPYLFHLAFRIIQQELTPTVFHGPCILFFLFVWRDSYIHLIIFPQILACNSYCALSFLIGKLCRFPEGAVEVQEVKKGNTDSRKRELHLINFTTTVFNIPLEVSSLLIHCKGFYLRVTRMLGWTELGNEWLLRGPEITQSDSRSPAS